VENTKAKLRESIRLSRRDNQSHFNLTLLTDSPLFKASQVIASYHSFGDEPDTTLVNQLILQHGKKLVLPAQLADNSIEFRNWDGNPDTLKLNGNVKEPMGEPFTGDIDLMIVPALAVDKNGNRLGQGGGSYDRALRDFTGLSIALINDSEYLNALPNEAHDVPVKAVLTPTKLIRI